MEIFTEMQRKAIRAAVNYNQNCLISGPAGSGKSFVINKIVQELKSLGVVVHVTAMVGLAAINIQGMTIHKYAGIGIMDGGPVAKGIEYELILARTASPERVGDLVTRYVDTTVQYLYGKLKTESAKVIRSSQVLICDEVSMMSRMMFEVINKLFQKVRLNYDAPFGGLQIVFVGDCRQSPPVVKQNQDLIHGQYFFESPEFATVFDVQNNVFVFDKIFRQSNQEFQQVLNRVADGTLNKEDVEFFKSKVTSDYKIPQNATRIYGKRDDVKRINDEKLRNLKTQVQKYRMYDDIDTTDFPDSSDSQQQNCIDFYKKNCIVGETVEVKKESYMMLCYNQDTDSKLANGSRGFIVGFSSNNLPLFVLEDDINDYKGDPKDSEVVHEIQRASWKMVDYTIGEVQLSQIPLIPCYSITIHKSIGLQFPSVATAIDRRNCFSPGMAYVSLSRCKDPKDLYLTNFDPSAIKCNSAAKRFYQFFDPKQKPS